MPETIALMDVLARHARERPDALAVRMLVPAGAQFELSYAQLLQRTSRAAALLWHVWGVRPGDRVAYLGFNHADQLTLLFALSQLGAVLVPLNFRLAPPEWDAVMADCAPCVVLHDAAWREAAGALAERSRIAAHPLAALASDSVLPPVPSHAAPEAPALLVYTSGTTGRPKGALHTQGNLLANMAIAQEVQSLVATDVVATVLPLFHVGGLCIQTLPALYAGASVLLHPRFDAAATLACIARDRPTLTLQVPATMKALIEHADWLRTDLSSLRAVWAGSSVLPAPLIEAFHARGVPLCNVYGATETGPFSIALAPPHARSHAGACGWPAPGVQVRLQSLHNGVGEVLLRAPNVVQRYWPDVPALDADGWFHTGDLAMQAIDGSYSIVGRAKDMIISGGENIYPAEIENLLAEHPAVADCAVLGMPDAAWGEAVVAVVVLRPGVSPPAEDVLRDFLSGRLARYKLPRRIVALESLPKTALGKVQKPVLLQTLQCFLNQ
ncbi:MAG TPA: AMP-binding protein [Burkholderiaceae bacterium]|nr:AMP-binding protein [Burkholderiaceae bacterium]